MDTSRIEALELRINRIEVKMAECSPKRRTKFEIPEEDKEICNKLIDVRKEIINETHRTGLNLVFAPTKLVKMIHHQCKNLDDLRQIRGFGENNIVAYGQRFLDVLNPPPPIVEPEIVEPPPVPPAILTSASIKRMKARAKPK